MNNEEDKKQEDAVVTVAAVCVACKIFFTITVGGVTAEVQYDTEHGRPSRESWRRLAEEDHHHVSFGCDCTIAVSGKWALFDINNPVDPCNGRSTMTVPAGPCRKAFAALAEDDNLPDHGDYSGAE